MDFLVDLGDGNQPEARFAECSITDTAVTHRGGDGGSPATIVPATGTVVLRRGVMSAAALGAWLEQAAARRVTIALRDEAGKDTVRTWTLEDARIVRHVSSPGDGAATEVDVEELELSHAPVPHRHMIRKLVLPPGFSAPTRLTYEDIVATVLTRADLEDDVRAINASIALIQRTRGGGWPTEEITEEFNFVDLVWHEQEFREATSFSYVIRDAGGGYLGCCYLYPMGRRTELTQDLLRHDVDVSWWVTENAFEHGYYDRLYRALLHWLDTEFPFDQPYFSNLEIPG